MGEKDEPFKNKSQLICIYFSMKSSNVSEMW